MPSETLHFENARVVQQLLNNDAQALHHIEQTLGIKATARDGWIKLEGAAENIERARQLFQIAKRDPKLKVIPAVERELVIQALKETDNNQVHAAKLLGITRATLRKRIEKFGIQRELNVK